MSGTHPGTLQEIAHRMRVATHVARIHVDLLGSPSLTAEAAADIRADLRGYLLTIVAGLDTLAPIHSVHDEIDNVTPFPRRQMPVRPAPPAVVAVDERQ